MNRKVNIWVVLALFGLLLFVIRRCEPEPRIITKTETVRIPKVDTIERVLIKEVAKTVFVERLKTVKGGDSIVYLEKPNDSSINANQYEARVESKEASADLLITTTGELLDVQGKINYTKDSTFTETIKIVPMSGLYIYGGTEINNFQSVELGLMYQIRNRILIKGGARYDSMSKGIGLTVGIGVKL